ncbi:hypothetical protein FA13DRAFT_1315816 [Coprinellus micaceus]|uniref:Uncharacterized protein n=1 Tax=Coprinellus micaceus TaxID=71717 RepID=A0A4Y7R4L1_COPMI|nr:hypothetical protein FA13DRAFT_1315816 [Coprinellus micaceus]
MVATTARGGGCGRVRDQVRDTYGKLQHRMRSWRRISLVPTDYMGDESGSEDEYDGNAPTSGSDTVMDVVFSDSSSDLDYEPEDYMMNSDAEGSDSEDMSSDSGVNELVYIDQPNDSVAIHGESSSDGLLSLATTSDEKASPSRSPVEQRAPARAAR